MAAGFQYFDSTQPGAPALSGAAGRLIAVLDWALVGMGGWAKAFSGANLAAYRSDSGNRFYLRVDDTQTLYTRLRGHRTMTAISTGTAQFPTTAQAGNINTWGIRKSYTAGAVCRYWGIRTNRYLVLFIGPIGNVSEVGAEYRGFMSFGDFPSWVEADAHNTMLNAAPNVDSTYHWSLRDAPYAGLMQNHNLNASGVFSTVSGTPNGAIVAPLTGLHSPFGSGVGSTQAAHVAAAGRTMFGPFAISSNNSSSVSNWIIPRGRLPNVHQLLGPCGVAGSASTFPAHDLVPFSVGARTFLPISASAYPNPGQEGEAHLLETTDTDGAL